MEDQSNSGGASTVPDDSVTVVNRLAQLALGLIPVLIAGLAAIGGATGGLSRLFRDQNRTATVAFTLVLLSVVLAALSRALSAAPRAGTSTPRSGSDLRAIGKGTLLLLSVVVLFAGIFLAVHAQIRVMGTSQAPEVSGAVRRDGKEYLFEGNVKASGVTSDRRVTIFAYQTNDDADTVGKPVLLSSSSGPNADGVVDVPLRIPVSDDSQYKLVVLTAVLGENQRDCDGRLVDDQAQEPDTRTVACLVLRLP